MVHHLDASQQAVAGGTDRSRWSNRSGTVHIMDLLIAPDTAHASCDNDLAIDFEVPGCDPDGWE